MKEIQPVNVWHNGQIVQATVFNLASVYDNLYSYADFSYQLLTAPVSIMGGSTQVASGALTMTGEAYAAWELNQQAWDWGAEQLNLTIIGDVTTTTTTTEAPPTTTEAPVETTTTIA